MPTTAEMSENLDISYPPPSALPTMPSVRCIGFQLMADEVKIESRLRWDSRTNMILGVCREHTTNLSMEFRMISQPDAIIRGINKKECHFASEVKLLLFNKPKTGANCHGTRPPSWHSATSLMFPEHTWKYNLLGHVLEVHPTLDANSDAYKTLYAVGPFEVSALKVLCLKKTRYTARKFHNLGNLNISDSHSTHLAPR
jgi:hypothetical protein